MRISELHGPKPLLDDYSSVPLTRERPDDPVRIRLTVDLRDGRTYEIELPEGTRPKVDLVIDNDPGPDLAFGDPRPIRTVGQSVRIVIDVKEKDGTAEDGSLMRFTVREPEEVSAHE